MCGRYSLTTPLEAVRQLFGFPERPNLAARVNIAPSQDVAAVRLGEGEGGVRHLVSLRWGLIPSWAKEASIGNRAINARAETIAEKPSFRAAFRRRRCLIPADGFYEWKTEAGRKQPYRITLQSGAPFAFAGLWERWEGSGEDSAIESCTIVTTEANDRLRDIHHRMPAILAPEAYDLWLDPAAPGAEAQAQVQALLRPAPSEWFTAFRVSPKINSPANDDPALIEPIAAIPEEPEPEDPQPRLL
jgi:putative SOS response-associated peptidase YedK